MAGSGRISDDQDRQHADREQDVALAHAASRSCGQRRLQRWPSARHQAARSARGRAAATATPASRILAQLVAQRADRDAEDGGRMGPVAQAVVAACRRSACCSTSATVRPTRPARAAAWQRRVATRRACRLDVAGLDRVAACASTTARCTQFSSSRTLPRHGMRLQPRQRGGAERPVRAGRWPRRAWPRNGAPAPRCRRGRSRRGGSGRFSDVEAEEQVLAESCRSATASLQVAVAGRDQADVDRDRLACRRRGRSRAPGSRAAAWPAGAAPSR